VLDTSVTRSSDKPTCILGSYLDVDVEACGMFGFEADLILRLSDESDSTVSFPRLPCDCPSQALYLLSSCTL
jgi:hypothetical protein